MHLLWECVLGQDNMPCTVMVAFCFFVLELCALFVCYFVYTFLYAMVHNSVLPFRISSCNFIEICIRSRQCVAHKNDYPPYLVSKLCPFVFLYRYVYKVKMTFQVQ